MTETITQTRIEDAIGNTDAFLQTERGVGVDGGHAGHHVANHVVSVQEQAEDLLTRIPHPKHSGLYVPLSKYNRSSFGEAAAILPGHVVLVPSALVDVRAPQAFYPAAVSEDGIKGADIRLHVHKQPFRQHVSYGAALLLSGAGQSETSSVGDCSSGRSNKDVGLEAEHFATLLAVSSDTEAQKVWQSGVHINHEWRGQANNSVTTQVSKRLLDSAAQQETITITQQQIEFGDAMLLWHEGMRDQSTGRPETTTRDGALVIVQALGYEALKQQGPTSLDFVRRSIA